VETFTFLFTDIEGSTVLLRRLREGRYAQVLADYRSLIRSGLAAHGGREVDTSGDGLFAVFPSPSACLAAAIDTQAALETHAWPGGEHVRVRMGIHTGEASQTATGLIGLDVHRAARVAAVGYGGQVLLSETAATLVRDSLPAWATLEDLGFHRLKDLGRPEHIFQLQAPGLRAEFPPLRSLGNRALPNNLPAQLSTFIGRARELSDVRAQLWADRRRRAQAIPRRAIQRGELAPDTDPAAVIDMLAGPIYLRRFIQDRPMTGAEIDDLATRVVAAFTPRPSRGPTDPRQSGLPAARCSRLTDRPGRRSSSQE